MSRDDPDASAIISDFLGHSVRLGNQPHTEEKTGIDRATGLVLLDEKMAGTVHLALGRSYPETGGRNGSALHWDLICDLRAGGRLTVDGKVLNEDGIFVQ